MFKRYFLFILIIVTRFGLEAFEIPLYFNLEKPKTYFWTNSIINIRTNDKSLGLIHRHIYKTIYKNIPHYELYCAKEGFQALAKVEATDQKYEAIFTILDKNDQLLGNVKHNWENSSWSHCFPILEIYSSDQQFLAIGEWSNHGSSLTLFDPQDRHQLITFYSKELFLDSWIVLIEDSEFLNRIDSCLLILSLCIAADKIFHHQLCGYQP